MNFFGNSQLRRSVCMLARQNFSNACEEALNKQIQQELQACHNYLAMAYHFDRSDVALPGVHGFFKAASQEERGHAERIMQYMNKRGGKIVVAELEAPRPSYETVKEAFVEALDMEKSVNQSLLDLHDLATNEKDPSLCDFLDEFLKEQVDGQKVLADYIRQIERTEQQLGEFIFDIELKAGPVMH